MSSATRPGRTRTPSPSKSPAPESIRPTTRNLRARPTPTNTNGSAPSAGPSSDPSPTPRKRMRAAQRPEIMERIQATRGYIFFVDLVDSLFARPEADGFRKPVLDLWTEDAVPGYLETIENPMDLGTIKTRLKEGEYNRYHPERPFLDEDAVMNDIVTTFKNCMTYNEPNSDFHQKALDLLKIAKKEFRPRIAQRKLEEQRVEQMRRDRRLEMERARRARIKKEKEEEERKKEAKKRRDTERRAAKKQAEEEAKRVAEEKEKMMREKREKERLARAERKRIADAEQARAAAEQRVVEGSGEEDDIEVSRKRHRPSGDTNGFHNFDFPPKKKVRKALDERSTSSISSDEAAEIEDDLDLVSGEDVRELCITFVSTKGMEKKRGRKSITVQHLEARHEELMRQRRVIIETKVELDRRRHLEMTLGEKLKLCEKMSTLDFVQMREVCQIIAVGTNQPQLLSEVEVDVDLENLDNRVLREIQVFLENPVISKCQLSLRSIESELADIEQEYVGIRYQTAGKR